VKLQIGRTGAIYVVKLKERSLTPKTDIKQALELILADKDEEIAISPQLELLIPVAEVGLLETDSLEQPDNIASQELDVSDQTATTSTFDVDTATTSTFNFVDEDQTVALTNENLAQSVASESILEIESEDYITNLTDLSFTFKNDKEEILSIGDAVDSNSPEVGRDELNSLADLFEGQTPDLEITWEQVEILDISTATELGIDLSDTDTKDSDSEFGFLFEQEANSKPSKINEPPEQLTLVQLFGDNFLEQEDLEEDSQVTPGLVIEFSYDDQHSIPEGVNNQAEVNQPENKVSKSADILGVPKDEISSLDDLFTEIQQDKNLVSSQRDLNFSTKPDDISSKEDTHSSFWTQAQQEEFPSLMDEDVAKSLEEILHTPTAYDDIFTDSEDTAIYSNSESLTFEELDISLQSEEELNLMLLGDDSDDFFDELISTDSTIASKIEKGEVYPQNSEFSEQNTSHLSDETDSKTLLPEPLELTPEFANSMIAEVEGEQSLTGLDEDTIAINPDALDIDDRLDNPFAVHNNELDTPLDTNFIKQSAHEIHQEFVEIEATDNLQTVFDSAQMAGFEDLKQVQEEKQNFDEDLLLLENNIETDDEFINNGEHNSHLNNFSKNELDNSIETLLNLVEADPTDPINFLSETSISEVVEIEETESYNPAINQTAQSDIIENEDAVLSYLEAQADQIEHGETIDNLDEFDQLDKLLNTEIMSSQSPVSLPDQEIAALEELLNLIPNQVELEKQASSSDSRGDINDQFKELVEMVKADLPPRSPVNRTPRFEQLMKVPVKHLDDLSNLVGELVVNRNTLEQDQERLRQSLDNLLTQVQQLSDVGTRMQELYERSLLEASLLASRKNNGLGSQADTDRGFSELEMDRFTPFHTLSQEMIELIVRVRESASDIDFITEESEQVARQFRQVTTQLQEGITRSRMEPFAEVTTPLERGVRESAIKYGKQARLVIEGRDTLIDKMILEHLKSPLTHLLNNAIAHGIETAKVRQASGKPPIGVITVRAFHQGNQTIISVQDDGSGIDCDGVKLKAINMGIVTAEHAKTMSDIDVYDLLFQPGFSTKDKEDELAGRGVGLDVVLTRISEIRGTISIDSSLGKGTTFTIRLPLTLSICKALCCVSDKARIAFPMDGVEDTLDIPVRNIHEDANQQKFIPWRDTLLQLRPLKEILTYNRQLSRGNVYGGNRDDDMISVVVVRSANTLIALQIDQVLSEQEIVIKQFEGPAPKPIGVAGATILGDGRIMPIADVLEIIDIFQGRTSKVRGMSLWEQKATSPVMEAPTVKIDPTVLIVDDSITVRELLSLSFNKAGYRVEQARDGQEAWDKLRSGLPCDLVFCDIEMPRCDGLELLSRIQKDSHLNHLPIAMLTSRGADKHRQMAIQLGASGYFTKPYLEEALLEAAARMLKGEKLVTVPDKD
jgi:chemosensory pili system protein ChpA (sensor histidine kinase/response regulator)